MLTNVDFIEGVKRSRAFFLRHVHGLTTEQIDFKPYSECKSVRESLAHLISDDRAALDSIKSGEEPDYGAVQVMERDYDRLLFLLAESHRDLVSYLTERYAEKPLDSPMSTWGSILPAARGIAHLSSEDFYHAGQVAYIRIATDPAWDYYGTIYGSE